MSQVESRTGKSSPPDLMPIKLGEMGMKRIEEFANIQTELLEKFQETNRRWFDRVKSEADLASEFASKLAAARSIPEVATVYQEWTSRHMEMAAEDAKRIFADSQKFAETGAHFLAGFGLTPPSNSKSKTQTA